MSHSTRKLDRKVNRILNRAIELTPWRMNLSAERTWKTWSFMWKGTGLLWRWSQTIPQTLAVHCLPILDTSRASFGQMIPLLAWEEDNQLGGGRSRQRDGCRTRGKVAQRGEGRALSLSLQAAPWAALQFVYKNLWIYKLQFSRGISGLGCYCWMLLQIYSF